MIIESAGALCYRQGSGGLEILLITSRRDGAWGIPKGRQELHLTWPELAEQEAYEEAGVRGRITGPSLGRFVRRGRTVLVFPMEVLQELETWPEQHERQRRWMSQAEAAGQVAEPELGRLIAAYQTP